MSEITARKAKRQKKVLNGWWRVEWCHRLRVNEEAIASSPPEVDGEPGSAPAVARTKVGVACAMKRAATRASAAIITVDAPILNECS
jgi:hypothetical protein